MYPLLYIYEWSEKRDGKVSGPSRVSSECQCVQNQHENNGILPGHLQQIRGLNTRWAEPALLSLKRQNSKMGSSSQRWAGKGRTITAWTQDAQCIQQTPTYTFL